MKFWSRRPRYAPADAPTAKDSPSWWAQPIRRPRSRLTFEAIDGRNVDPAQIAHRLDLGDPALFEVIAKREGYDSPRDVTG